MLGKVISVAELVGEGDGDDVDVGVVLADGGAVEALDAAGGAAQAVKSPTSAAAMRVRGIQSM